MILVALLGLCWPFIPFPQGASQVCAEWESSESLCVGLCSTRELHHSYPSPALVSTPTLLSSFPFHPQPASSSQIYKLPAGAAGALAIPLCSTVIQDWLVLAKHQWPLFSRCHSPALLGKFRTGPFIRKKRDINLAQFIWRIRKKLKPHFIMAKIFQSPACCITRIRFLIILAETTHRACQGPVEQHYCSSSWGLNMLHFWGFQTWNKLFTFPNK